MFNQMIQDWIEQVFNIKVTIHYPTSTNMKRWIEFGLLTASIIVTFCFYRQVKKRCKECRKNNFRSRNIKFCYECSIEEDDLTTSTSTSTTTSTTTTTPLESNTEGGEKMMKCLSRCGRKPDNEKWTEKCKARCETRRMMRIREGLL